MRRLLVISLALFLAVAASASAKHQDPKKQLTKVDNTRARAMLVKQSDLRGYEMQQSPDSAAHGDCDDSVSEADLTLTGEAETPQYVLGVTFVNSSAQVYESRDDASASWRRAVSPAGVACMQEVLRRTFRQAGARLDSYRRITFPRIADRSAAYRLTLTVDTPQGAVPLIVDLVVLMRSRAQAGILLGSALVPPARADELRLARIVARRMAAAMRGA